MPLGGGLPAVHRSPAWDGGSDAGTVGSSEIYSDKHSSHMDGHFRRPSSKASCDMKSAAGFSAFTAPLSLGKNSGAFVHGTKSSHFHSILQQGLRAAASKIYLIDEMHLVGRVPGLKDPPEILIFIDEGKAASSGMAFTYDPSEGSWSTSGINGIIRPWFFQKVVDNRTEFRGTVLFQSKDDPSLAGNLVEPPSRLVHATFWENIYGIQLEGLIPAKNPISETRKAFGSLLQGAENHVYTMHPDARARANSLDSAKPLLYNVPGLLDRKPDVLCTIDVDRAMELGLDIVQSADRSDTYLIKGPVPRDAIVSMEPNVPVSLPDHLMAKIVDPKSFQHVPIIDLREDEATILEKLKYACEVVGFLQVVGHGVPREVEARRLEMQKRFFNLPAEKKLAIHVNAEHPVRGYFGKGSEDLDGLNAEKADSGDLKKTVTDNKEGLDMNGVPWSHPGDSYIARVFGQSSHLPADEDLPGLEASLDEYHSEMFTLSKKLLRLMAMVLGQNEHFFEKHLTRPVATSRLLHYWPLKDFAKEIGCGEHTDYGLLTILKQDQTGGLQVLNAKDMVWIHATPVEDAYVVNLGDMLARWTGDHFKSTVHRVVNLSPSERYSAPYFLEPNLDTVIQPGELFAGPRVENQEAFTAEEILARFYKGAGMIKS